MKAGVLVGLFALLIVGELLVEVSDSSTALVCSILFCSLGALMAQLHMGTIDTISKQRFRDEVVVPGMSLALVGAVVWGIMSLGDDRLWRFSFSLLYLAVAVIVILFARYARGTS